MKWMRKEIFSFWAGQKTEHRNAATLPYYNRKLFVDGGFLTLVVVLNVCKPFKN